MSQRDMQEKCEIIYNDTDLQRTCPHGEGCKVASYACKNCTHCYGEYTAFSVYCGKLIED
jgi:hypothetical protein